MKKYVYLETVVEKIGKLLDYINLPIVKDDRAIGIVSFVEEVEEGYKLTLLMFNSVDIQLERNLKTNALRPSSINIG